MIRCETDRGYLLYWPPCRGVLYCPAGAVSARVPVRLVGLGKDVDALDQVVRRLRNPYRVERLKRLPAHFTPSSPIPEPKPLSVRPRRKACRGCGSLVEVLDWAGECDACAAEWKTQV